MKRRVSNEKETTGGVHRWGYAPDHTVSSMSQRFERLVLAVNCKLIAVHKKLVRSRVFPLLRWLLLRHFPVECSRVSVEHYPNLNN